MSAWEFSFVEIVSKESFRVHRCKSTVRPNSPGTQIGPQGIPQVAETDPTRRSIAHWPRTNERRTYVEYRGNHTTRPVSRRCVEELANQGKLKRSGTGMYALGQP